MLGWQVLMPLETCLEFTADWYDVYLKGGDVAAMTRKQIEAFEAMS